jgi:hypothetical protein
MLSNLVALPPLARSRLDHFIFIFVLILEAAADSLEAVHVGYKNSFTEAVRGCGARFSRLFLSPKFLVFRPR